MTIISLYKLHKNTYDVFFAPAYGGSHIVRARMIIIDSDVDNYNLSISSSYRDAHREAHLTIMSEDDYDISYQYLEE